MQPRLSMQDVERLIRAADPDERALAAHRICRRIAAGGMPDQERAAAAQILNHILEDKAEAVRRALAVALRASLDLPRDVALRLIADADSVAAPALEHSPVLTDSDLIAVVLSGPSARRTCVARRMGLSAAVVRAIRLSGDAASIAVLAKDETPAMPPAAGVAAKDVGKSLIPSAPAPTPLPASITQQHSLPASHAGPPALSPVAPAFPATVRGRALATMDVQTALDWLDGAPPPLLKQSPALPAPRPTTFESDDPIDQAEQSADPARAVRRMRLAGELTESLLLRAACIGAIRVFDHVLAELTGLKIGRVRELAHDSAAPGLRALLKRAGLSPRILPAIRTALEICDGMAPPVGSSDARRAFSLAVTQRVLTRRQSFAPDDLDYLLARVNPDARPADARAA